MDKLLAEAASLTPELLANDENAYDKTAAGVAAKLHAIPYAQLVSKSVLDVSASTPPGFGY